MTTDKEKECSIRTCTRKGTTSAEGAFFCSKSTSLSRIENAFLSDISIMYESSAVWSPSVSADDPHRIGVTWFLLFDKSDDKIVSYYFVQAVLQLVLSYQVVWCALLIAFWVVYNIAQESKHQAICNRTKGTVLQGMRCCFSWHALNN